jgi:tRNA pseudouridine32 synthase/23S rRNA pseudouridine746 synthase
MKSSEAIGNDCFHSLEEKARDIELPQLFTFPFFYEPHPLSIIAAQELQKHLESQTEWQHNFGLDPSKDGLVISKMFGVLVVKDKSGKLGYLAAFSGKLAEKNHHRGFVPPIYDMLEVNSFYKKEEKVLNECTKAIDLLEQDKEFLVAQKTLEETKVNKVKELAEQKEKMRLAKKERKIKREAGQKNLSTEEFLSLKKRLSQESIKLNYYYKDLQKYCDEKIRKAETDVNKYLSKIALLKKERKNKSSILQARLFDQYQFLNADGTTESLVNIFKETPAKKPPAGAGECAAPKLLQYAYLHNLKPIAIAEFWWGQSPSSQIRKHRQFYPACRSKCEPILGHMLKGLAVEENPMLTNPALGKEISIVYEDEDIAVVNKPAEFLSVPGKNIKDSVYARVKALYPEATGPLIVHRLDQSTSGLMIIAKNKDVHKDLQKQFQNRTIKKKYVAVIEGIPKEKKGTIELPLRVDLDNRPHQLVCYDHGKSAKTQWKLVEILSDRSKVNLYPITGRTHQLRVHAAHPDGLNMPIVGDDLYGTRSDRLLLHAARIEFIHPTSKERLRIKMKESF